MGYAIINYLEERDVYVDDELNGRTNKPIRVEDGTHKFDLGMPEDYEPASQEVLIANTDVLNPMQITFTKKAQP